MPIICSYTVAGTCHFKSWQAIAAVLSLASRFHETNLLQPTVKRAVPLLVVNFAEIRFTKHRRKQDLNQPEGELESNLLSELT